MGRQLRSRWAATAIVAVTVAASGWSATAVDGAGQPIPVPVASSIGGVAPAEPGSDQDPRFVQAKLSGRVSINAAGAASIAPVSAVVAPTTAPASKILSIAVTGKIIEPPGSGSDDRSKAYSDGNYWNMCAPGSGAVVLAYWANSASMVTGIAGQTYTEPSPQYKSLSGYYATTFWWGSDTAANGRGLIMYLGYFDKPAGETWQYPGVFNWSFQPGVKGYGTPPNRLRDAINWEISGRSTTTYFYISQASTAITEANLISDVHGDVSAGVPVSVAALTADGSRHLPLWSATGKQVNHQVTIVGYNDTTRQFTVVDTCGVGCNTTGISPATRTVSQLVIGYDDLWALIGKETDHDGIIW